MLDFLDFSSYGYAGMFAAAFLASTLLPLGSEALLSILILNNFNLWAVVLVASLGNYLGACTSLTKGTWCEQVFWSLQGCTAASRGAFCSLWRCCAPVHMAPCAGWRASIQVFTLLDV